MASTRVVASLVAAMALASPLLVPSAAAIVWMVSVSASLFCWASSVSSAVLLVSDVQCSCTRAGPSVVPSFWVSFVEFSWPAALLGVLVSFLDAEC